MAILITIIICLLIGFISLLIYKHAVGKPSYKCSHKWLKTELWKTNKMITYRFTCSECGKWHDNNYAHYTEIY